MPLSDSGSERVISSFLGSGSPSYLYVALILNKPQDGATGSTIDEPGSNYQRVRVANSPDNWESVSPGKRRNKTRFRFPTAADDWGVVTYWGLCDSATDGVLFGYGKLTTAGDITEDTTPVFTPGSLAVTLE
jgi:hypothetical protein